MDMHEQIRETDDIGRTVYLVCFLLASKEARIAHIQSLLVWRKCQTIGLCKTCTKVQDLAFRHTSLIILLQAAVFSYVLLIMICTDAVC